MAAWDCAGFFSPVQVMKDGDDPYKAMTLDLETGEYEEMFELEFALDDEGDSQHVNAVGLLGSPVGDPTVYYAIASSTSSSVGSMPNKKFVLTRNLK